MNADTHNLTKKKIESLDEDENTKRALNEIFDMVCRLGIGRNTKETKINNCRSIVSRLCKNEDN